MGLKLTITELLNKVEELKKDINNNISEIPDNKKINRTSKNCFTIKFSDLSKNLILSPSYYDNLYQAKAIQEIICSIHSIVAIQNELISIAENGRTNNKKYRDLRFNDEVREFIKGLL